MIQKNYLFLLSLLGHCLVLALVIIKLSQSTPEINLGESPTIVSSFIYQSNSVNPVARNETQKKHQIPLKTQRADHGDPSPRSLSPHALSGDTQDDSAAQSISKAASGGNGKPIPELVALLHDAIQQKQQYPASALQMEREGNITLTFMLFPNGLIQNLRIIKASGTTALDEAALTAVNEAIPFKKVDKYLSEPKEYQITVRFELT